MPLLATVFFFYFSLALCTVWLVSFTIFTVPILSHCMRTMLCEGCLLILKVKQRTDASHAHTAMLSSRDMSELLAEFRGMLRCLCFPPGVGKCDRDAFLLSRLVSF